MKTATKTLLITALLNSVCWGNGQSDVASDAGFEFTKSKSTDLPCLSPRSETTISGDEEVVSQRRTYLPYIVAAGAVTLVVSGYCAYKYNEEFKNLVNGTAILGLNFLIDKTSNLKSAIQNLFPEPVVNQIIEAGSNSLDVSTASESVAEVLKDASNLVQGSELAVNTIIEKANVASAVLSENLDNLNGFVKNAVEGSMEAVEDFGNKSITVSYTAAKVFVEPILDNVQNYAKPALESAIEKAKDLGDKSVKVVLIIPLAFYKTITDIRQKLGL